MKPGILYNTAHIIELDFIIGESLWKNTAISKRDIVWRKKGISELNADATMTAELNIIVFQKNFVRIAKKEYALLKEFKKNLHIALKQRIKKSRLNKKKS